MAEETPVTTANPEGVARTADGTIADQPQPSSQNTTQETPKALEGKTVLTEQPKPEDKKEESKAAEGAPEKYEDYKVPDGYTLDPAIKTEADTLFKSLGLSQTAAQSLVDFYTAKTSEAFAAPFKAYQEMTDGWRKDAENHPDLRGKLGPGQEVNVRIAKALDGLGDAQLASDFRSVMDLTGVGNHPAFIRVIDALAKRMTEGSHVQGNGPAKAGQSRPDAPERPSAAAAMWPTLPSASDRR